MVFADARGLVRIIDITELVIDHQRLDLVAAAKLAEGAHLVHGHRAISPIAQSVLPQIGPGRPPFATDDGEQGLIAGSPVQAYAHRSPLGLADKGLETTAVDGLHIGH